MKKDLNVTSYYVSLYDLLDGNTPEQVKTELDSILNNYIVYIREGCKLTFDVSRGYDDETELNLLITRKETDQEYAKRLEKEKTVKDKAKDLRLKEYLRLKAEFEGEINGS
jgi:hypothetical protein